MTAETPGTPRRERRPAMTPAGLRKLGEHTYGAAWQTELANDLSLHRTTVERWNRGERAIQPYFARKILECCRWRIRTKAIYIRQFAKQDRKTNLQRLGLEDFDEPLDRPTD